MVANHAFNASEVGDLEGLKSLQVNESLEDEDGASCLHYAARGGSIAVVEYLTKTLSFSVLNRSKTGASVLHDAAASGQTIVVGWLLENTQANVNDQDGAGLTPIHLASRYGHYSTVEYLLDEANADIDIRSALGAVPLHFAVVSGDLNCVKILLDEKPRLVNMHMNNGITPLYLACQLGYLNIAEYLVDNNAAAKIKAYDAMSCLHAAAQQGHLNVVKFLLKQEGINPNDRDFDGATPLHYASSRGHPEVVKWLVKQGGAKFTLDNLGGSPLHSAATMGQLGSVRALLDCGCDVTLTDNDGLTAAELADVCHQAQAAALIRGDVLPPISPTPSSPHDWPLDTGGQVEIRNHVRSPQLFFPPPPPFPPEEEDIITQTAATNTSLDLNDDLNPSDPCPSDKNNNQGDLLNGNETYIQDLQVVEAHESVSELIPKVKSDGPLIARQASTLSIDSSASNFGVFEYPAVSVLHTVTAEVHGIPSAGTDQQTNLKKAPSVLLTSSEITVSTSKTSDFPLSNSLTSQNTKANKSLDSYLDQTGKQSLSTGAIKATDLKATSLLHLQELRSSTKSAFSKARALFESSGSVNTSRQKLEINPDNGEAVRKPKVPPPPVSPKPIRMQNTTANKTSTQDSDSSAPGQSKSIIKISGEDVTIIEAKSDSSVSSKTNGAESPSAPRVQPLLTNGHSTLSEQLKSVTLSSSASSPTSIQPKSPEIRKNDLIADIQSAVSGNSSLSLRRTTSRGEGVSCVYQSSKSVKKNGGASDPSSPTTGAPGKLSEKEVINDHKPLTGDFDPSKFLDKIGKEDSEGRPIPDWRRHVLARHMAEKAQKEFEEKKAVDDYEARFKNMPAWKRALIERREAQAKAE